MDSASHHCKKRVILLGKGDLAIRVADWFLRAENYELAYVVPDMPEPTWTGSITQWCVANDVPFVASGRFEDLPGVRGDDWHIDIAFSVFYGTILPAWFLAKAGRALNLHNSALPRNRGVSPINWALKNREPHNGVTIHEMTPAIDNGPIVAQLTYSIYPEFDEVIDVYRRALSYGWTLFEQTMPNLDRISPTPQDDSAAVYHSRKENVLLNERRDFTRAESLRRWGVPAVRTASDDQVEHAAPGALVS